MADHVSGVPEVPGVPGLREVPEREDVPERGAHPSAASTTVELRLYVAGQTPKSVRAIENLRQVCEQHLAGQYAIELVDLLENPRLARGDEIIAIPTLVRRLPQPIRKVIGDLSDTERVLVGLQLRPDSGAVP